MAEGGHNNGSEDGEPIWPIVMGSQDTYEYYCQPCDGDDYQVEAEFYCNNCDEYFCKKCSLSHRKFKQSKDHVILGIQHMTDKPPIGRTWSTPNSRPSNSMYTESAYQGPVSTRQETMATGSDLTRPLTWGCRASTQKNTMETDSAFNHLITVPASNSAFTTATHVKDITLKGKIDSSAIISANQLLVADCAKNRVRLVDTDSGRQVSELELSSGPWQVTRISDTEAAVILPLNKKIVLIRISKQKKILLRSQLKLSVDREISIMRVCYSLAYTKNKFIVPSMYGHVDILDLSGKVICTIPDDKRDKIFFDPWYATVDSATSSMYVSDMGQQSKNSWLVKLSEKGRVEAIYRNDTGYPSDVALDTRGMVYLAWKEKRESGCVYQLDANCTKVRTIIPYLSPAPQTLSYDEATQLLYVGKAHYVKVYKLS